VLYLLAACQKYEFASVQSSIRAKVKLGEFPVPRGVEAFSAYAIASGKGLIPEMENAARQTLDHPMTFEVLGEGLGLFEGWALRDLVNFRRRCVDNLVACLDLFLEALPPGPSSAWVGCPESGSRRRRVLPKWLDQLLIQSQNDLKLQKFTDPLVIHLGIRGEYLKSLQTHLHCEVCLEALLTRCSTFCTELENKLEQARDKVTHSFYLSTTRFISRMYVVIAGLTLI
jgi:predicted nucleic acid-binding Zn ribbon protein